MLQIHPAYDIPPEERLGRILEDMSNYIMIPIEDQAIKLEGLKPQVVRLTQFSVVTNLGWRDFHEKLNEYKKLIPNQVDRLNTLFLLLSDKKIYDGNGNKLDNAVKNKLRDTYLYNVWECLSTSFSQEEQGLLVNHGYSFKKDNFTPEYCGKLEKVLLRKCLVDLTPESFNSQGLPIRESKEQDYKAGENIYYSYPVEGRVAGLGAGADRSSLYCDRVSSNSYVSLGACAKILGNI